MDLTEALALLKEQGKTTGRGTIAVRDCESCMVGIRYTDGGVVPVYDYDRLVDAVRVQGHHKNMTVKAATEWVDRVMGMVTMVTLLDPLPPADLRWQLVGTVRVDGKPKAEPRHRTRVTTDRSGFRTKVRTFKHQKVDKDGWTCKRWQTTIMNACQHLLGKTPLTGPIQVDAVFLLPRPVRLCKKKSPSGRIWHPVKPDRDNLDKAVLDALTKLRLFKDDAPVCAGTILKYYRGKKEKAGAIITIWKWEGF